MNDDRSLSAAEAAHELGVTVSTLYAYVSRGLVRSEATPGGRRQRRYLRDDIERLAGRKAGRRDPEFAARAALRWGAPVLDSQVTLIADGRHYYRGRDAVELAARHSFEDVARLIWESDDRALFDASSFALPRNALGLLRAGRRLSVTEQMQAALPLAQAEDPAAYVLTPDGVVHAGARIVRLLTWVAADDAKDALPESSAMGVAETLQRAWAPSDTHARELLDAALVLLADHELNVSSFTARCVASAGSTPYAVVIAGLAALQGHRHGGLSERVTAMLAEAKRPDDVRAVIQERWKRGETIPGFDHPLYPQGDPRCSALLARLDDGYAGSLDLAVAHALVDQMAGLSGLRPNVDFALATLCRTLRLPPGASIAIFAISRTVGWTAQAMEQYALGALIRPRARYVGLLPD